VSARVDHVLLTRFNLPSPGAESLIRAKDGWLRGRLELFESYCLPSVRRQTNQNFHWIMYFDPESPSWLTDRISVLNKDAVFTAIYRAEVSNAELLQDLEAVCGTRGHELITTNLDNDDGLAADFVARVQNAGSDGSRTAIYLASGLVRCGANLYLRTDRTNAFCSVREEWDGARTCWTDWHNLLGRSMKVKEVHGGPAWLQLVHDSNVSNRVRGRRVPAAPYGDVFSGLLVGVSDFSHGEQFRDWALGVPYRSVREAGRSMLKMIALNVLGKDGLDRLKADWALRPVHRRLGER
jgi:hypothetical protein